MCVGVTLLCSDQAKPTGRNRINLFRSVTHTNSPIERYALDKYSL